MNSPSEVKSRFLLVAIVMQMLLVTLALVVFIPSRGAPAFRPSPFGELTNQIALLVSGLFILAGAFMALRSFKIPSASDAKTKWLRPDIAFSKGLIALSFSEIACIVAIVWKTNGWATPTDLLPIFAGGLVVNLLVVLPRGMAYFKDMPENPT